MGMPATMLQDIYRPPSYHLKIGILQVVVAASLFQEIQKRKDATGIMRGQLYGSIHNSSIVSQENKMRQLLTSPGNNNNDCN